MVVQPSHTLIYSAKIPRPLLLPFTTDFTPTKKFFFPSSGRLPSSIKCCHCQQKYYYQQENDEGVFLVGQLQVLPDALPPPPLIRDWFSSKHGLCDLFLQLFYGCSVSRVQRLHFLYYIMDISHQSQRTSDLKYQYRV